MNKEEHAQNIISTISNYFMTQRIKPSQEDYTERLIKHHAVIIEAMKAKQNADVAHAEVLKKSVEALLPYYPGLGRQNCLINSTPTPTTFFSISEHIQRKHMSELHLLKF